MIHNLKGLLVAFLAFSIVCGINAQELPDPNWHHFDGNEDDFHGISTKKLYKELIKDKKGEKVVVAVIDGGTEIDHEDLKNMIWKNPGEIAGNNVDDDKNGFVDDVYGWNFIGGRDGEPLVHEQTETMRLYLQYDKRFKDVNEEELSKEDKVLFDQYIAFSEQIEEKKAEASENVFLYQTVASSAERIEEKLNKENITPEDLKNHDFSNALLSQMAMAIADLMVSNHFSFQELKDVLKEVVEQNENTVKYYYNAAFSPRQIIGDNPSDFSDISYGNNLVAGPRAEHGTHVAGIIGAERNNGIGMDGVANNVELMILRVVPDGDERDKDISLAIRYAVDNGASIINMSFGKDHSPYKKEVDEAVKYALKNDVLLVHAAGNDNREINYDDNFPNDFFLKKGLFGPKYADNWIEVGASSWEEKEKLAATFTNYSSENVDVFAPGVRIYSTVPDGKYKNNDGTSMASPVVAGIAALLRSYFPDLSAKQVKDIIMKSARVQDILVTTPGGTDSIPFKRLSITGGIANAYDAFQMAMSTKGKNGKKRAARAAIWQNM